MPNLYELAAEFEALRKTIDEGDDAALVEQALDLVDESKSSLAEKVDNICKLLADIDGNVEKYKREEGRLSTRRKTMGNSADRLRDWLRSTLDLFNVSEVKTDFHKVSLQPGQPTVVVTQPHAIPEEYQRVKREPNKKKIMEAFKEDGVIVKGCDIVPGKSKLVIR